MKLTQSLCFSSSNGGDELLDEGFILVLFLLLHLCIMCMWCKRDLNVFFVSSSLPREACKVNFWCMTECFWLWRLFVHRESKRCLPKTASRLMLLPEQRQLKIFLFMKWMPVLFVESEIISKTMYHYWIITFTAWGECRGKFSLAIINSSQIKKKAIPRWAVISNTTVKHNEHADQK